MALPSSPNPTPNRTTVSSGAMFCCRPEQVAGQAFEHGIERGAPTWTKPQTTPSPQGRPASAAGAPTGAKDCDGNHTISESSRRGSRAPILSQPASKRPEPDGHRDFDAGTVAHHGRG